jgi:DNA polymerase IIIc chi subunit
MNVNFYSLDSSGILKALISLVEKAYTLKYFIVILVKNQEQALALDKTLWTLATWLPHSIVGDIYEKDAKILICEDVNFTTIAKHIDCIFVLNDTLLPNLQENQRAFIIFEDSNEEFVKFNKDRWSLLKSLNYQLNFFKKDGSGKFYEAQYN